MWAGVLLALLLVQLLSFFVGMTIPMRRLTALWNKTIDERREMLGPEGASIKKFADRFPLTARVYLMYPTASTHKNSLYYFYPRLVSITMTDACYEADYKAWNERPPTAWLIANGYTHVVNYKDHKVTKVQSLETEDGDPDVH